MALPKRKPKVDDPQKRWRSSAHTGWLTRNFCCAACGAIENIQAAHVSIGSEPSMGMKPDDFRTVPLCGPSIGKEGCHNVQHRVGERTFWQDYEAKLGQSVEDLIVSLCKASPKSTDIARVKRERGMADA